VEEDEVAVLEEAFVGADVEEVEGAAATTIETEIGITAVAGAISETKFEPVVEIITETTLDIIRLSNHNMLLQHRD